MFPLRGATVAASARSRRRWLRGLFYGAFPLAALDAFGWEPRWLRTRRLRLSPAPVTRFAFFTDLHFKGNRGLLDAVVSLIQRERPGFALFGGDLVEEARHLPELLETLRRFPVPLYGVPGNHDYWSGIDFDEVQDAFGKTGGGWLVDRAVEPPGQRTRVSGFACRSEADLPPSRGMPRNVALVHYPAWADRVPGRFDLVLAGHSHGGQVRLPFLGALVTPAGTGKYQLGRYETAGGPLHVSSGVGTFFLNVRFLCPPECLLVEL